jgi:hypothetical protein
MARHDPKDLSINGFCPCHEVPVMVTTLRTMKGVSAVSFWVFRAQNKVHVAPAALGLELSVTAYVPHAAECYMFCVHLATQDAVLSHRRMENASDFHTSSFGQISHSFTNRVEVLGVDARCSVYAADAELLHQN